MRFGMRFVKFVVLVLVLGACSSGVSEEEHEAALEQVSQLEDQAADLVRSASVLKKQLATAEDQVTTLEDELSSAADDLASANERYGELADLAEIPNDNAATLITVLARGTLRCGIAGTNPGFSEFGADGTMSGIDADFCRAVAAAVLGDADSVEFVTTGGFDRFDALRSGAIDVLIRNTTRTLNRDAALGEGADFGPTIFYDGQQFMGRSDQFNEASGPADVDGARLCVRPGFTQESDAVEWAASGESTLVLAPGGEGTFDEEVARLQNGICDLITSDGSHLAGSRFVGVRDGTIEEDELVVFPVTPISREPLGPAYRQGDTVWADIVTWVMHATVIAEEAGITSTNIDAVEWSDEIRRLFGVEGTYVEALGLDADAFYRVVKQVGNYGEIFDRNLTPLGIIREGTPNALHTNGGLIYAPPAR